MGDGGEYLLYVVLGLVAGLAGFVLFQLLLNLHVGIKFNMERKRMRKEQEKKDGMVKRDSSSMDV